MGILLGAQIPADIESNGRPEQEPSVETEENLLRLSVGLTELYRDLGASLIPWLRRSNGLSATGVGFGERYFYGSNPNHHPGPGNQPMGGAKRPF